MWYTSLSYLFFETKSIRSFGENETKYERNGVLLSDYIHKTEYSELRSGWLKWEIPPLPQEGLRLKYLQLAGGLSFSIGGNYDRNALPIPFYNASSPTIVSGSVFSYPAESITYPCANGAGSGTQSVSAYTTMDGWVYWAVDGRNFSPGGEVMLDWQADAFPAREESASVDCSTSWGQRSSGSFHSQLRQLFLNRIAVWAGYVCEAGGKTVSLQVEPASLAPRGLGNDTATLTVTVRRCGEPARGETVRFRLEREEGSGGHNHPAPQASQHAGALGTLDPATCVTDDNGRCRVTYTAPEAAGRIFIMAEVDGARSFPHGVTVRLSGLQPLEASPGLILIGDTNTHRENHYGTPRTLEALRNIGDEWVRLYPNPNDRVGINDMSLEWGGLFDIHSTWAPPHDYHRTGENVDVRTVDKNKKQLYDLRKIIRRQRCTIYEHRPPDPPHWHLTCQQ
jgi:hypothetical protein